MLYGRYIDLPEAGLESHHIFGGVANRPLSEKYGLKVWLCRNHHTGKEFGVHFNKDCRKIVQEVGQWAFERKYPELNFTEVFGKNYKED